MWKAYMKLLHGLKYVKSIYNSTEPTHCPARPAMVNIYLSNPPYIVGPAAAKEWDTHHWALAPACLLPLFLYDKLRFKYVTFQFIMIAYTMDC